MLSTISLESSVRRILVEKRQGFDLEAKALKKDLIESLHIDLSLIHILIFGWFQKK